jgi:hypothetical protein
MQQTLTLNKIFSCGLKWIIDHFLKNSNISYTGFIGDFGTLFKQTEVYKVGIISCSKKD